MAYTLLNSDTSFAVEDLDAQNSDGVIVSTTNLDVGSTGTGGITPFLVLQETGNGDGIETGYNTDAAANALPLDVKVANQTRSILLSDMGIVSGPDGTGSYYVFLLDANESTSQQGALQYVSLSGFTLYLSNDPDQNGNTVTGTQIYSLPQDILVNSGISNGSGNGYDLAVYVPTSLFANADPNLPYLILQTEFGGAYDGAFPTGIDDYLADGGFEEWTAGVGDPVIFVPNPSITVNKVTSDGTTSGDGLDILTGTNISWIYTVTNNGNVELTIDKATAVLDNNGTTATGDDFFATYSSGDADNDGILDVGEAWLFTATGIAGVGSYSNIGTATASYGTTAVTDDDDSGYFGQNPDITMVKNTVDGSASGDGLDILADEAISWTYTITNTGNVALTDIAVTDDDTNLAIALTSQSMNDDAILDVGETWVFTATGLASIGAYSNLGTVTANFGSVAVTDSEGSSYFGLDPSISLVKTTVGAATIGGTPAEGDGITIVAGTGVTWNYALSNDGNVGLNINTATAVLDNNGTAATGDDFYATYASGDNGNGVLDVGETWLFTASGMAGVGNYANTATATAATVTDDAGHSVTPTATDTSSYTGLFVENTGARTQGYWNSRADTWDNNASTTSNPSKASFADGTLHDSGFDNETNDVNPLAAGSKYLLLGDANGNGIVDAGETTLKIDINLAKSILAASTTGDARLIMLAQTIAAQLNIDNGIAQPNNLIQEAMQWLTNSGSWAGFGYDLDANDDGIVDMNGTKLAGSAVSTSSGAWQSYVAVGNGVFATGEGLKNALMWFNDGHLVTSLPNGTFVGWDEDGAGGSTAVTFANLNTGIDNFWLTLNARDDVSNLTGIM